MTTREQLIEGILHSSHALRNQIKTRSLRLERTGHSQWFVLKIIEHYKSRSIKDVAETLGISSSAATQLVDGLVRRGYVTRHEDRRDRRSVRLELSPKGKKYITTTSKKRIAEMAGVFDALTDGELEEYLRLQKKILSKHSHG